jgi:tetratricopeptide (TPR) repeat protein
MFITPSINIIHSMACTAETEGRVEEASRLYLRLLRLARREFGQQKCALAPFLCEVADFEDRQNRIDLAIQLYLEALEIYKQQLGKVNLCSTLLMARLANLYRKAGDSLAERTIRSELSFAAESLKKVANG